MTNDKSRVKTYTANWLNSVNRKAHGRRKTYTEERSDLMMFVSPSGQMRWAVRVTKLIDGKRHDSTRTVGYWPEMPIEQARDFAALMKSQAKASPTGITRLATRSNLGALIDQYVEHLRSIESTTPSAGDYASYLTKLPGWFRALSHSSVSPDHIQQLVVDYKERLLAKAAVDNRVRSLRSVKVLLQALRNLFKHFSKAENGSLFRHSPCVGIRLERESDHPALAGKPALTTLDPAHDLWLFWRALDEAPMSYPLYVHHKLELLTGKRGSDLRHMLWDHIEEKSTGWECLLPGKLKMEHRTSSKNRMQWKGMIRTKNGKDDLVCLSPLAAELLCSLREYYVRNGVQSPWVFCNFRNHNAPLSNTASAAALARFAQASGLQHVTGHGLRRSFLTLASSLGISDTVKEKLLHHQPKDVTGKHYDRFQYRNEKHTAVLLIAQFFIQRDEAFGYTKGPWSDDEDKELSAAHKEGRAVPAISAQLNRSPDAVRRRLNAFDVLDNISKQTKRYKAARPKTNTCQICGGLTANVQYCSRSCSVKARHEQARKNKDALNNL